MTDVLTKCDYASRFILAVEPKIVFAKVNKAADTKEYTKFAAEL
jgi:hypothetical protein